MEIFRLNLKHSSNIKNFIPKIPNIGQNMSERCILCSLRKQAYKGMGVGEGKRIRAKKNGGVYPGDLVTRTGEREIRSVYGRFPDNPGELA